ncbi:MAG: HD domain-containing protein [Candidatus Margulisiibacteriota bacterium]
MKIASNVQHYLRLLAGRPRTLPVLRPQVEMAELAGLARHATKSVESLGRARLELPCEYRTAFVRDRDRIIYSPYFTALSGKTQVFSPESLPLPSSQQVHTRLFHVIKVAQLARDICRALGLNEDLAEAIALGHDLGHSPFGHEGEKILSEYSREKLGEPFKHNRQSLRIVREIADLNLSYEVQEGILKHDGETKDAVLRPGKYSLRDNEPASTLEACVVRLADRLSYLPLDLEDGIRLGLVSRDQLPSGITEILGSQTSEMINALATNVIEMSAGRGEIALSPLVREPLDRLFDFNYQHIYYSRRNVEFRKNIAACLNVLIGYFAEQHRGDARAVIDNIVALTDQQAFALFNRLRFGNQAPPRANL